MLNNGIEMLNMGASKQLNFGLFGLFFHQKKITFLSFRSNQYILSKIQEISERKIGFYFFVAKLIDIKPTPSDRCKHWHPPT